MGGDGRRAVLDLGCGTGDLALPMLRFADRIDAMDVSQPMLDDGWLPGEMYTLYDLEYKYIHCTDQRDEFYDLVNDPLEQKNLIDESREDKVRLLEDLKRFRRKMAVQTVDGVESSEEARAELRRLGYAE